MIELEILVEVFTPYNCVIEKLKKFNYSNEYKVIDIYYYDPLRESLKPIGDSLMSSFRIRNKGAHSYITYKDDIYDGSKWLYSNEDEIEISNFDITKNILSKLGFKELVKINNIKKIYYYDSYEIVLEKVEKLGTFLEVELKKHVDEKDVVIEKKKIQAFIDSLHLNVSEELNCGKPELFIRKNNIKIN